MGRINQCMLYPILRYGVIACFRIVLSCEFVLTLLFAHSAVAIRREAWALSIAEECPIDVFGYPILGNYWLFPYVVLCRIWMVFSWLFSAAQYCLSQHLNVHRIPRNRRSCIFLNVSSDTLNREMGVWGFWIRKRAPFPRVKIAIFNLKFYFKILVNVF